MRGPVSKFDWAHVHLAALRAEVARFLESAPYRLETRLNAEGRCEYVVAKADLPPDSLALIAGDLLFNLRGALDHLAQLLYLIGSNTTTSARHVSFPIAASEQAFKDVLPRRTNGMRQDAIDFIVSLRPWEGGNDDLWHLNELNNIDKHRLLVTVGGAHESVDIGALFHRDLAKMFEKWGKEVPQFPTLEAPFVPADKGCPLKVGDVLFIDAPGAEPSNNIKFNLSLSLHEPGVLPSTPIGPLLEGYCKMVEDILVRAEPLVR